MALPVNLRKALAEPAPRTFSPKEIKHVVLAMQENRSFDHYFGTMPGVRGYADPTAITLASTGESVFYQPDPQNALGYLLPYHLDSRSTAAQAIPSTSHSWGPQHNCWDGGKMDDWVPTHISVDGATVGPFTMGYYERDDIPFHWALAENFTVLDNYHCSVLGPTSPNRVMWFTGSLDPNGVAGGPVLTTESFNGNWQTYAEALTDAGVSWRVYDDDPTTNHNVLQDFQNFKNAQPGSVLYDNGIATSPTSKFAFDCLNGDLPAVTWLCATEANSEHPNYWPALGASWVASQLDAIAANRELWESTVFILNYDENDGLFDHVVPPTPPAGTPDEFVTATDPVSGQKGGGLPVGLGFRVPCIIVSPWTQGGWVCSDVSDHTSTLKFLEVVTGVPCTQISAWRRQTVSDLTGAFAGPGYDPVLPVYRDTAGEVNLANYTSTLSLPAFPTTNQTFPIQPPGRRPHTA
jgi:phospholipase C